ncbi:Regulator of telomere elongation helicase 1 [Halocaridina rubra]|uniref:Regulator of telomere elongation helicase 1 homolog n=1 Tax=Halocaridina rubra TaxID=373956 RepID=A0AAN8X831_HALRR
MPEFVFHGVPVRFPFEPYDVQKEYMSKVIECLQKSENGILESPTGTGKTLCLLCASLGWLEIKKADFKARVQNVIGEDSSDFFSSLSSQLKSGAGLAWANKQAPPKIIYSSRTHSQLSQAISELRRTTYSHFKVAVLGSRDQMCVHPEVSKETNNYTKVHMCQIRVKAKNCYFSNQVDAKRDEPELRNNVLDLEDLVKLGKKKTFCPYYMARELKQDADIIFMPYNYLLDPKSRKAHGIELQGNIVIFDEAHNVEKTCEEAASLQIKSSDLALCIDEITQVMKKMQEISDGGNFAANEPSQGLPEDFSPDDLYTLKALFLELEKAIDAIKLPADGSGATFPGSFMFEILEKAEITPHKKTIILDILEKLVQYLTTNSASPFQRKGAGLQKFSDLIKIVFSKDNISISHMEFVKQCYKVHINTEDTKKKPGGRQDGWGASKVNTLDAKAGRVVSYWCFNPGFGMRDLTEQGVKCILLTSGTLSPLESFVSELQVPFPVQLENPHIIQRHQVWVGSLCKGPDGFDLNSSYQNRSNPKYIHSLGQTILNFTRVIPDGLLVFFPSYPIMRSCQEEWQNSGIWGKISQGKPIFVEPQIKDEFQNAMIEFYQKINDPVTKGACFMAVCRGKVSEGLDFADRNGRAVIVTGLPYPPVRDPRVMLKQKYLDEVRSKVKKGLLGTEWYRLEASRAVNQAIGRVIRHKDDFGAIILCDNRFGAPNFRTQLSAWVQPHMHVYNTFGPAMRDITLFFKNAETLLPAPKPKSSGQPVIRVSYETSTGPATTLFPEQAFGHGTSKPVVSDLTRHKLAQAIADQSDYNNVWSDVNYATGSNIPITDKLELKSNESIFSVLESKANVVDFNSACTSSSTSTRYESLKTSNKKRKITLVNQSENHLELHGNNTKKKENSQMLSEVCIKGIDKPRMSTSTTSGEESGSKNRQAIAKYLKDVKTSVGQESYKTFSAAVKDYKASKDYEATISVLSSVFLKNPEHHKLFEKFQFFLTEEHKQRFPKTWAELMRR